MTFNEEERRSVTDESTIEVPAPTPWPERAVAIVALLRLLTEGLPESSRRDHSQSGFVDKARSRTCPDCLANGRKRMIGCETCGGSGEVRPSRLDAIAATDVLLDDGDDRDPYKINKTVAYGLTNEQRDREVALESAIARAGQELRRFPGFRPESTDEEIEEANKHPYVWERERAALRKRFDIDRLSVALDELRNHDAAGYSLLHGVYVYGVSEPSTSLEAIVDRALRFLSERLPDPLRAPGFRAADGEFVSSVNRRQARRAA